METSDILLRWYRSPEDRERVWAAIAKRVGWQPDMLPKMLGKGTRGMALYGGGNRVLKLTDDASEAEAMSVVKANPSPVVAKTFDVFRPKTKPLDPLFGIVLEKLKPVDAKMKSFADDLGEFMQGAKYRWLDHRTYYAFIYRDHDWRTDASGTPYDDPSYAKQAEFFKEVGNYLDKVGIRFADAHSGNVMMKGSQYKMIDLGYSESRGGQIDTLTASLRGGCRQGVSMNRKAKREVVATLIQQGRRDLARQVAGGMKPVDKLHLEEAIMSAIDKTLKKKKLKIKMDRIHMAVQRVVDGVEKLL